MEGTDLYRKGTKGVFAPEVETQRGNEAFNARAPTHIVERLPKQAEETKLLLERANPR